MGFLAVMTVVFRNGIDSQGPLLNRYIEDDITIRKLPCFGEEVKFIEFIGFLVNISKTHEIYQDIPYIWFKYSGLLSR